DDRVAADADGGGEADVPQLVHHLVGERAGLGHEADAAGPGDVGQRDADVRLAGTDDAGAVRADEAHALVLGVGEELGGVGHREALGDDADERHARVDGLDDRALGVGRRDEDDGDVRTGGLHGLRDGAEDGHRHGAGAALLGTGADRRDVEVDAGAGLARVDAADDLGAGAEHPAGVLLSLGTGHALDDDARGRFEDDRHAVGPGPSFASAVALAAASSIVSTMVTSGWLASSRMRRPSTTLLPSRRTTSGLVASSPRISSALTMPLATSSQAVIPPKTLTNTLLTCSSPRMTWSPLAMTSALAPPPMSRKFAGPTPYCSPA